MTQFDYNRDRPAANNKPSVDQPLMKINTNSIDDLLSVDHISFNEPNGGFHAIIHALAQNRTRSGVGAVTANFPSGSTGAQQIFAANYTPDTTGAVTDTQLFSLTANGGVTQLTGNRATADGWCWVGGILLQWGTKAIPGSLVHAAVDVTFKDRVSGCIPFPNNCFVVIPVLQANSTGTTSSDNTLSIRSFDKNTFRAIFNGTSSNNYPNFFWFAIGN